MGEISEKIRDAIESSGESQLSIAHATGVNSGILSRFMRGERGINLKTVEVLCEYFGLRLTKTRNRKK